MTARSILSEPFLILDGGMGTMLQSAGLPAGYSPDAWSIEQPDKVADIHRAYLDAGAQVILTNTFGSNAERQKRGKYPVPALVEAAVENARKAAAPSGAYVALDIGPLGAFLEPLGDLTVEEATELFAEPVRAGAAGADCILIETMCDVTEAAAAVAAAKRCGSGKPVFCTMSFDKNGRLMTGADVAAVVKALTEAGVSGLGANCGVGPEQLVSLLPRFRELTDLPILMSPNAGLPVYRDGETHYDLDPEAFAQHMQKLRADGAWALGGCCGTTPAHIAAMCAAFRK